MDSKALKNFNIFEAMLVWVFKTGNTGFTTNQAIRAISLLKDRYPFVQYVSRLGKGNMWTLKPELAFGRQMVDNFVKSMQDDIFDTHVNSVTGDITVSIVPIWQQRLIQMWRDKKIATIPQLSGIYYIKDDVFDILEAGLSE
jgi:hypothetical protein